ncbi:MAG UNVERIFIED_CONTAM: hypothetical protein LVR29_05670 [Microcystis novacekii LVE1205-3]|jgi:HlyD family secretion protein
MNWTQAGKNVATTTNDESITPSLPTFSPPEQSVILKQSPIWSRTIIWTLMSVTTAALIWSAVRQNRAGGRRSRTT